MAEHSAVMADAAIAATAAATIAGLSVGMTALAPHQTAAVPALTPLQTAAALDRVPGVPQCSHPATPPTTAARWRP
jgi:hypothetical protein